MARGAAQARRKAAKTQPGKRKQAAARRPPTVEQTMFFPRLRRQAKWVFLALAVVFAGGFVFFGVGSGSTGLGDLLRGNFNIFGSNNGGSTNSSAVRAALKNTRAHPRDPNAWNDLATAYQSDGKSADANKAYLRLLKLRPNDLSALQSASGYYETRYQNKITEAQTLQQEAPLTFAGVVGVSSTSQIGQALSNDPTSQQLTQKAQAAFSEATTVLQKDAVLYKRIARLQPGDLNTQYHYAQVADVTGDSKSAIAAYEKVIKLARNDPSAQQSAQVARQRIAALSTATHR
jgi:tetratricopeptide (TPR) repeat protein